MPNPTLAIGLMSGTSADGVSAALISIDGKGDKRRVKCRASSTIPYDAEFRRRLFRLPYANPSDLSQMNFELGERLADAALKLLQSAKVKPAEVEVIGSHGHTVVHLPLRSRANGDPTSAAKGGLIASTLQIGESAVIAERTGITTVGDFRVRDVAAGGEGAPLVPYVDGILFRDKTKTRALQNIGGIANVTIVTPKQGAVMAFDTGPGNGLIDETVRLMTDGAMQYDRNGAMAAEGRVDANAVQRLLLHSFFAVPPPRSADRETFLGQIVDLFPSGPAGASLADQTRFMRRSAPAGSAATAALPPALSQIARMLPAERKAGIVATLTQYTAESIYESYRKYVMPAFPVDEVYVSGGGAMNATLLKRLQEQFGKIPVRPLEELGIPGEAKEAVAFAVLGHAALEGEPNNCPAATGAKRAVICGKIVPGR